MKKILKRTGKIFCLFLLIVVLVNILSPLFCRKPDEKYVESLRETEFTSETAGVLVIAILIVVHTDVHRDEHVVRS